MQTHTVKPLEKAASETFANGMAKATEVGQQLSKEIGEVVDSTMSIVKTDLDEVTRAGKKAMSFLGSEIVKRPITYTLAAAGIGALIAFGLRASARRA